MWQPEYFDKGSSDAKALPLWIRQTFFQWSLLISREFSLGTDRFLILFSPQAGWYLYDSQRSPAEGEAILSKLALLRDKRLVASMSEPDVIWLELDEQRIGLYPLSIGNEEVWLGLAVKADMASASLAVRMAAASFRMYAEGEAAIEGSRPEAGASLHKTELLYDAVRRLNAKIDVDDVLAELMDILRHWYPSYRVDVFLSQDHQVERKGVRPLVLQQDEQDPCTEAFVHGKPVVHRQHGECQLALPMSGKQGIYGVIRITRGAGEADVEQEALATLFSLVDNAGVSFENAVLHEHSKLLVTEYKLINEMIKRLNQSLKLTDILEFATVELVQIFHAEVAVILQLSPQKDAFQVTSTNWDEIRDADFPTDYGFCGIVHRTKEPLIISDFQKHPEIESRLMLQTASRSLLASPIIANSEVIGVILITHQLPNFFSYNNYKLLQIISGHIGLAMTNASLHAEVRRMVITDNLTGLYARHYLNDQVRLRQNRDFCGSLIVVDIDNFKMVNDTFGHQIGDQILIQVSEIIQSSIRESDIAARWGGEELAVYLPQVSVEQGIRIAERIRSRVSEETNPKVTVSCGISEWKSEDDKISVESLFYKADMALYQAKHSGKNQYQVG
ncbi:sensor domain-containing diguanylate cyclase [Paenibacillus turpanensis]|uniref:sensor domain-containing diguanylate cyclase n=1 Tax=Paenibacillus turpanensis TaxID=2689078 RepID=UPI00140AF2BB|nr:sensor domain-containing diguanylate cyclase [Paenibacillus turpanensis]